MPAKKSDPRQNLAETVRRRREELGMTQQNIAEAGGPSIATVRAIETARAPQLSARTITSLERALNWKAGSIQDILTGNTPTEEDRSPIEDVLTSQLGELRSQLATLDKALADRERALIDTSVISMRVDTDAWDLVKKIAGRERRTVNDIIVDAIGLYADVMGEPRTTETG